MDDKQTETGELAFEHFQQQDWHPVLYRVTSLREACGRTITHVRWFTQDDRADEYVKWINDGRGKVVDFAKYVRVED